jgi:hypothetical protein
MKPADLPYYNRARKAGVNFAWRTAGPTGRGGMQGVGPAQLTYYSYQDDADKEGGCWKPRQNIRIGLRLLKSNIRRLGEWGGVKA